MANKAEAKSRAVYDASQNDGLLPHTHTPKASVGGYRWVVTGGWGNGSSVVFPFHGDSQKKMHQSQAVALTALYLYLPFVVVCLKHFSKS